MTDFLAPLGGLLLGAGILFGVSWWVQVQVLLDGALQRTAHTLALGYYPGRLFVPARLAGDARGVRVSVECRYRLGNLLRVPRRFLERSDLTNVLTVTRITVWADLPEDVHFTVETGALAVRRAFADEAVVSGDPEFDAHIVARGEPGVVFPILTAFGRETIRHVVADLGATYNGGVIEIVRPGYIRDPRLLTTVTRAVIRMGAVLQGDGRNRGARLQAIVEEDPVEGVAARALALLLAGAEDAEYARDAVFAILRKAEPDFTPAEPALLALLAHRSEPVRLAAACGLGSFGTAAALPTLSAVLDDPDAGADLKAVARSAFDAIEAESPDPSSDSR